jgi:hypothetical protein
VLCLLAHGLEGVAHPALDELGVALLKLQEPHAVGEPLLGRAGVFFLEPHELEPVVGKPDAPALGGREVLGESLVGVALDLGHLAGGAPHLLSVGARNVTPTVILYSLSCLEGVFSKVGHAFPAKTLMNSAVGQPLGKEILGSLGPPAGFIS